MKKHGWFVYYPLNNKILRILIVSSDLSKHSTVPIHAAAGLVRMCLKNIAVGVQSAWMYQVCKLICNSSHEPRLGSRPRGDKRNRLGNIYSKFNKKQRESQWLIFLLLFLGKWFEEFRCVVFASVASASWEERQWCISCRWTVFYWKTQRTDRTVTHQRSAEITLGRSEPSLHKMSVMQVEFHTTETRKNNFISGSRRLMRTC